MLQRIPACCLAGQVRAIGLAASPSFGGIVEKMRRINSYGKPHLLRIAANSGLNIKQQKVSKENLESQKILTKFDPTPYIKTQIVYFAFRLNFVNIKPSFFYNIQYKEDAITKKYFY